MMSFDKNSQRLMKRNKNNEKNISAQQQKKNPETRLFKKNVNQTGPPNYQSQESQGQKTDGALNKEITAGK